MAITVYGIPNCDTVKKARAFLDGRGVAYTFHDFRKQGVPAERLDAWLRSVGWETLVNRKGNTWRQLDASAQAAVTDAASARALVMEQPTVVKRPVVDWGAETTVGFDPAAWAARVGS